VNPAGTKILDINDMYLKLVPATLLTANLKLLAQTDSLIPVLFNAPIKDYSTRKRLVNNAVGTVDVYLIFR
jgi:hypothetical protein